MIQESNSTLGSVRRSGACFTVRVLKATEAGLLQLRIVVLDGEAYGFDSVFMGP